MRGEPAAQPAPPPQAAPPPRSPLAAAEPGEFTRMMESPLARGGSKTPTPPMFPPSTPGGVKDPGEFTRLLESPFAPQGLAGQPVAAPPPRPKPSGDATRAFQVPQAEGSAPAQQGPSEFTRMFQAPAPAPPAPAPKAAVKKPAVRPPIPKKKTNYLLWILVGLAVALALILILYLVLK
jgi:hypothetical protein